MRASIYYGIAVILLLATVPMYRYVYRMATAGASQLVVPAPARIVVRDMRPVPAVDQVVDNSRRRPLGANDRCIGGVVVNVQGTVYTESGLRCADGYAYSPLR
jgi:hypothetical protein